MAARARPGSVIRESCKGANAVVMLTNGILQRKLNTMLLEQENKVSINIIFQVPALRRRIHDHSLREEATEPILNVTLAC